MSVFISNPKVSNIITKSGNCHIQRKVYFTQVLSPVFYSTEGSESECESDASADFEEEEGSDTSSESSDWTTGEEDSDCDDAKSGMLARYYTVFATIPGLSFGLFRENR